MDKPPVIVKLVGKQPSPSIRVDTSPSVSNERAPLVPIVTIGHEDPLPSNVHPMIPKSKVGVFNPKTYGIELSMIEPKNIHEAMTTPSWQKAADDELQALIKKITYEMGCKWLAKIKRNPDRSVARNKARLTVGSDYHETFSLIVKANISLLWQSHSNGRSNKHM
ncbi:Retrovirus-related Pol polyprotein from transposon TNT 1-94 [Gossypium australe]|uniref:Retrovirus-related Pol polyprotein from transposon TNT 1-94 n=1 Tax=Gossypium australe TaxID=47621 RepID=A0A5B6V8G6_9ROSI|nr:Retrovirus-related Pol polyprotein from transposon TNT 1-94 [Gossypium australe]